MPAKKKVKGKKVAPVPINEDDSSSSSTEGEDMGKPQVLLSDDEEEDASSNDDSNSVESGTAQKGKGFTDENATWLKPKKPTDRLPLDSDDESGGDDDDDEEEEEDDELLEVEREAQLVDEELEAEEEEAEEEMKRTISEHTSIYHLPTPKELEKDVDRVVPPSEIRGHIENILEVLADFKSRREPGRSRKEYIDQLGVFIAELYGYLPELIEYFLTMFSPAETLEFVDASEKPRPLVIRTNTLKARRKDLATALIKRGVSLDPLASWSKVGLKIVGSPVPIGATPEYLSGMYMLQSAASMCPVLALVPEPKEKILDISAAPGGKTSYIAQLMRNTGVIIANDLKPERQKATVANLHRLGVKNTITCAYDGRNVGTIFKNRFDRILCDVPCSGLGVISRDPSVKVQRTMTDVKNCAHLQKEILLAAIDALKCKNTTGGILVYSTCSVSIFENEEVVNYALQKRDIQIIDTGLEFGTPGFTRYQEKRFHPSLALARRLYPHTVNMDGFFVCKIKKLSDGRPGKQKVENAEPDVSEMVPEIASEESEEEEEVDTKKRKAEKKKRDPVEAVRTDSKKARIALTPTKQPKKKQKTNAKVTKPRRPKKNAMEG